MLIPLVRPGAILNDNVRNYQNQYKQREENCGREKKNKSGFKTVCSYGFQKHLRSIDDKKLVCEDNREAMMNETSRIIEFILCNGENGY
jgi:hypothetical protein